MQLSDTPIRHILVKADTDSQWDLSDFAIIRLPENWKQKQFERLEAARTVAVGDPSFLCLTFYDSSVDFYRESDKDGRPAVSELLKDRVWAFMEIGEGELDHLTPPESTLDCYRIAIYGNGDARYKAYGKHTGEEFWTSDLPLPEILGLLQRHDDKKAQASYNH